MGFYVGFGGWRGGRGAPFILVSGGMLLGLAARIMRPASKATDTSVSCTAWRSMAAIVCVVKCNELVGVAERRRCLELGWWRELLEEHG